MRPYGALIDRLAEQANLDSSALCYRTLAIRDEVSGANESNDIPTDHTSIDYVKALWGEKYSSVWKA